MINIHYFGTCRVHAPLNYLHEKGIINLKPNNWSFLHTSSEILQAIKIAKGLTEIDNSLSQLAGFPQGAKAFDLSDTDCIVIEVSSLKSFQVQNVFTQLNRVREHTVSLYPRARA